MSKPLAAALCSAAALLLSAAPASAKTMAECNKESKGLKGEEHKQFMSKCMSKEKPANPQQEKMKECNKAATGKKGAERKAFMSDCLKKK